MTSGAKAAADHAKQQQQQAVDQSHGLFTPQQQQQYLAVPTHQVPSSIMANHGAMQQYQDNSNSSSRGGSTFHAQAQLQQLQGGGGEVMQFSSSMVQPPLGAGGASVAPLLMPLAQQQMAGATADQQGPELQLLPAPLQHVGNGDVGYGSGGDGAGGGEGLSEGFAQQAGSSAPQGSANPVVVVADGSQWQDAGFARAVQAAEGGAAAAEVWDVMGGGGAYGIGSAAADTPAAGEAECWGEALYVACRRNGLKCLSATVKQEDCSNSLRLAACTITVAFCLVAPQYRRLLVGNHSWCAGSLYAYD